MLHTIYTKNLVKKYGARTVVNQVSIEVKQGEIVGLLGPNGAGKTTTFYQVVGLIKPDEGTVFLDNEDITHQAMYKRAKMGLGYLPQEASVFRKLSVEDNIAAILEMTNLSRHDQRVKLESLISEFRLGHVRKNNGDVLSGGERRRTEIARALAVDPKFILLDEPFAGIDPIAVEDIQAIVAKLKYKNIGILITDHNVTETLSICDRAYLLIEGKIYKHGTAEELAADDEVKRLYLGRNFELRRQDYLHDEARGDVKELKQETVIYSLESAISLVDKLFRLPLTVSNIRNPDEIGLKDLSAFIKELKKSLTLYNSTAQSNRLTKEISEMNDLKLSDYGPNGILLTGLSYLGRAGSAVAYQPALEKLENDLGQLNSSLNRILMLVKNSEYENVLNKLENQ